MALAGFSKSPIAAASVFVALTGFAAVAATPGFTVTETIVNPDKTTTQTTDLAPTDTADITVTVSHADTGADGTNVPTKLTLTFTLPTDVDFSAVSGCDLPKGFDPSTDTFSTCTITTPFPFDQVKNKFALEVSAVLTVARHLDKPTPATCPTADLGDVTVQVTSDKGDTNVPATAPVHLTVDPYADIDVTATAPANANRGDTISVVGTIKNLGPCVAPNVRIDPQTSSAAGVSLLTFASISGACTQTVKVGKGFSLTPTPGQDGSCVIASLAPGASATITKAYTVDNVSVQNQDETLRTSGYQLVSSGSHGISDPNPDNDVAGTATVVPNSSGGCSTGGAIGPMALLGLMLVLSRKRRTA